MTLQCPLKSGCSFSPDIPGAFQTASMLISKYGSLSNSGSAGPLLNLVVSCCQRFPVISNLHVYIIFYTHHFLRFCYQGSPPPVIVRIPHSPADIRSTDDATDGTKHRPCGVGSIPSIRCTSANHLAELASDVADLAEGRPRPRLWDLERRVGQLSRG